MELRDFEIKQRNERAMKAVEKYGNELWHYTDFNALNGILNEKKIWFGSTASMNDKDELSGFIKDLKSAVLLEIDKENVSKAERIFEKIQKRLLVEYPYIFCVSRAYNDAAQWDRYAYGGTGVAIVFDTELLYKLIFYNRFIMNEEYYGYNAKQHKMKTLLVDYIQDNKMEEFSDIDGLIDNLLLCAMIHKHESFSAEQEVRLSPYFIKNDDSHLEYRVTETIRRIYVVDLNELCQKENMVLDDLIKAIVIGPKSKQNIEDLKWYLNKINLPGLAGKVRKSDCPLR
ncbi:DUF2971 domain-containing protein [Blautia glucerasea]|mgnify:FL=1|uniref:DUF2971 domain-containing protein n=1 Tax=Blautia glucerasea TaxID=536633 RepID=UPI00156F5504|nr:DUF2971 domain-containing protein [Blautia glucerasea]NSL04207.1 DUF2971 domain-containing protein [Blautia glucerasea]DAT79091.1 MAG TPA: Protein of unknown function (DUF2971) [Caudoviricetes sp.]